MADIHKDDIGTIFEITLKDQDNAVIDLSGATTKEIRFKPPSAARKDKSASFKTDGSDGILTWTTISNDLDSIGAWQLQGYVVLSGGTWYSDIGNFTVVENL